MDINEHNIIKNIYKNNNYYEKNENKFKSIKTIKYYIGDNEGFPIILIGDSCVGKTCLLRRFKKGEFYENNISTIGVDLFRIDSEIDSKKIKIIIFDTAGQERFHSI